MRKLFISLIIVSLLISLSLLGGADLLIRQFCSAGDVGGFCGVLHGMSGMMTHLSFIETLLVFIPALFAALTLIGLSFVNRYEYAPSHSRIAMPLLEHGPEISRKEISWLAHHTNSPGAF